ncbi:hypothetical protein [Okeania sp. SIO2C9]|uniref:hypothetical protein n=1 Tax=Okeania sp. SIO2C9 TaxID=2607791 RepID=UPI0025E1E355|nr:hypothetical protein [Okeania sp. SIO2C9]
MIVKPGVLEFFYQDSLPQTYMGKTLLIDALFEGLELTAEQVFIKAGIPTFFHKNV